MKLRSLLLVALLALSAFLAGYLGWAVRAADDLQIWVGDKKQTIDSRDNQGNRFFELKDIAEVLHLQFEEQDGKATLAGSRGQLQLTGNRPLVRFKDEYILLNQPVWRRKEKNWYVSEDFLQKALPLILSQKLEKQGALQYRVRPLDENRVQVDVTNFPDHVRVVFTPSQQSPIRIQELQDSILVTFGDYLVVPRLSKTKPDARIVDSVQFVASDVYGAFSIGKGSGYYNFREYALDQPDRRVIDLYAPPVTARSPVAEPVAPPPAEPAPPLVTAPALTEDVPVYRPHLFGNVVTVDPGHGGEDYGAHPNQDELEKNYTLKIAQRIEERLRGTAYRGVLTRTYDTAVTLAQRSALANYYQSKCYVSIHMGGAPSKDTNGPVVYVCSSSGRPAGAAATPDATASLIRWDSGQEPVAAQSRRLADLVQAELNTLYGTSNQVVEVPLTQLESVTAPAILVEAGFLTHPEDQQKLASVEFQGRIAAAVVKAVQRFLP